MQSPCRDATPRGGIHPVYNSDRIVVLRCRKALATAPAPGPTSSNSFSFLIRKDPDNVTSPASSSPPPPAFNPMYRNYLTAAILWAVLSSLAILGVLKANRCMPSWCRSRATPLPDTFGRPLTRKSIPLPCVCLFPSHTLSLFPSHALSPLVPQEGAFPASIQWIRVLTC
jgi:hypothetical protein